MKKTLKKISIIADCLDCGWRTENYQSGDKLASSHAKRAKHKVSIEVGYAGVIDARKQK